MDPRQYEIIKNLKIPFSSKEYRVIDIIKKTKANGFKDVNRGDILEFVINLESTVGARNGIYASTIEIYHYPIGEKLGQMNKWENSQNIFINNISNFRLNEI